MADPDENGEKSHEPTQHKLEEARRKGELARSADLNTTGSHAGLLLAALAAGGASIERVSTALMALIDQPERLADLVFDGAAAGPALGGLLGAVTLGLVAWFLIPAVGALLSVIAQRSFVVAPSKLEPQASRINPIENARNKYGPSGLFEFAKSLVKLLLYCLLLSVFLGFRLSEMAGALHAEPHIIGALMAQMIVEFLFVVLLVSLIIGAADFLWQHHDHLRRQRMSHKEVRDEHKQNEGDPHMKQQRRQRGMQIASTQMMAAVPQADVVIVNPTHYAVALKWSRKAGSAPVCVAKGVDQMALAIRNLAFEHGVPVHQDPPTARVLHASTDIGQEIDATQYRAVASAIRFADAMRRKARHFG
ncbi:flagellar biosynthetic protein FlhB [Roseovarius azorensis]|uniref:Flagellar biosynthetic protein FlhB n=1 Tax=Roseovarius azorensis TaxID=1287727 RepID=A0A1H7R2W0_9RHOB|nr:flagellar type III secretion system protein FlhB [Roseovarius azorensis]SEL54523.1 flagellar biosynthetic protein FlhB [Roseovarius azorensis]